MLSIYFVEKKIEYVILIKLVIRVIYYFIKNIIFVSKKYVSLSTQ